MDDVVDHGQLLASTTEGTDQNADEVKEAQIEHGKGSENETLQHPFSEKTWKEDLTLVVGGYSLFVSKTILAMYSKFFNAKFEEGPIDTMEMCGKSVDSVVAFLCCIYPTIRKPVTIENLQQVLPLALEFECEELVRECVAFIRTNATRSASVDVLLQLLQLCRTLNLKAIEELCWKAVEERDISDMEEMEKKSSDTNVRTKITTLVVKKLKHTVRYYISTSSALTEERDSLKGIVQFLMDDMDVGKRWQIAAIMGGTYEKVCVTARRGYNQWQISDQTECKYNIRINIDEKRMPDYHPPKHFLYCTITTSDYCSNINGRLTIVNRVNRTNDRHFPFYGTFSKDVKEISIKTIDKEEITDERKGFLVQSEALIEITYISKSRKE